MDGIDALSISGDYDMAKGDPWFRAIALGQRLVPMMQDGFLTAFTNKITDRMAIGLNRNFIFIVQGEVQHLSAVLVHADQLPVSTAINCDGGHVVHGKGPVHLVFRWQ